MKVVIVGCTHAGTIAATQILNAHPDAEVVIYERNDNVSFLSCGIAVYLSGEIGDPDAMFYSSPKQLEEMGATVKVKHNVLSVDPDTKTLEVENQETGELTADFYDKLIITTGSWPVIPPVSGLENKNLYLCKTYYHAKKLFNVAKDSKKIVVVGGGYIGVELVEAYLRQGREVTLIDSSDQMLIKYFDKQYADRIGRIFKDHNAHLELQQRVTGFEDDGNGGVKVLTNKGKVYDADMAVLCVGFRPNSDLVRGKIDLHPDGTIKTNAYMQTSNPDIYAGGDVTSVHFNPTNTDRYVPLATNAVRQGTIAGVNVFGNTMKYMGTQSTTGLHLFGNTMVCTGLTLRRAKEMGIDADSVTIEDNYRPEFLITTTPVFMPLVWEKGTRRILGAQFMSKHDVSQSANLVSVCIQNRNSIDFLAYVDTLFQPNFDRPFNYVNLLAQAAVAKEDKKVSK